jgi:transposase-like protein
LADVEILAPRDRWRLRGAQKKSALLAEGDAEGAKARNVARRHGVSESLLRDWRSARKAGAAPACGPEDDPRQSSQKAGRAALKLHGIAVVV